MEPEIIYEDNDVIVCYKPAGIATETRRLGQPDMVSLLRNYRAGRGEDIYIGMVHRLDQPVEGLLVFAKTQAAAAGLSRQVQERSVGKYYYAVACRQKKRADTQRPEAYAEIQRQETMQTGRRETEVSSERKSGVWTDYLLFDKRCNLSRIVSAQTPQAKRAELEYRIIGESGEQFCFDITLHTGRHHQIRAQMAHHGFPLVGDRKYGSTDFGCPAHTAAPEQTAESAAREPQQLALCSYRLNFSHPVTDKEMNFEIIPHNQTFNEWLRI